MANAFQQGAFQSDAFQMDQEVTITAPIDIEISVERTRQLGPSSPLVGLEKRFVVVGRDYDLMGRRIRLSLEQLVDTAAISIPATIILETFELGVAEPQALVILETFELLTEAPANLVILEQFEMTIAEPATVVIVETFETN